VLLLNITETIVYGTLPALFLNARVEFQRDHDILAHAEAGKVGSRYRRLTLRVRAVLDHPDLNPVGATPTDRIKR